MKSGQTLVFLLMFLAIGITVTTAAVMVMITQSQASDKLAQSTTAYAVAESGAENAILRLLRDPTYLGETLTMDSGTATISATGTNPKTILSQGKSGNYQHQIQVVAAYDSQGRLSISSWQETY